MTNANVKNCCKHRIKLRVLLAAITKAEAPGITLRDWEAFVGNILD